MNNKYIIICPNCGAEYLPGEIYLPKYFFGNIKDVVKDRDGKIISFYGKEIDTDEYYTCDYCSHKFSVKSTFKLKVEPVEEFKEEYVVPINNQKMSLFEDL